MITKKIRVLTDLLDHLQRERLDLMRQVEERAEQVSLVSELLHAAALMHEVETDKDDDEDEDDEAPEDLNGVFRSMDKDFLDFLVNVHTTSEEDDDHDED